MKSLLVFVTVISLSIYSEAKRHCMNDEQCAMLGNLVCVKTGCKWGTCGCPAGQTAKFLGSGKHFQCVPNRRFGEHCSTDSMAGVCLAPNSYCEQTTKRCACRNGYVPAWGGEACVQEPVASETCHAANPATCNTIASVDCFNSKTTANSVILGGSGTCMCPDKKQMDVTLLHGPGSYWPAPTCLPIRIGDTCLSNSDCPSAGRKSTTGIYIQEGKCDKNTCVCITGTVANYDKSVCKEALSFGETCSEVVVSNLKHCNGEKGLVCGDLCAVGQPATNPPTPKTCVCGPSHSTAGTSCTKIDVGGACFGDLNCKGLGPLGVCVAGYCQNSGGHQVASLLMSLVLSVMAYVIRVY